MADNKSQEDLFNALSAKINDSNIALNTLNEGNEETNKLLLGIDKGVAPIKIVGGILTKILAATIGNAVKFDKMAVANADINVNLFKLSSSVAQQTSLVGSQEDHLKVAIQLHRVGYKKLDIGFQDSLVLLNKQGGQGEELIAFMGELLSKGASQKTQVQVAKEIAKVANNTTTTANAAIASLSQLDDLQPMFQAMGFGGNMLKFLASHVEDMPKESAIAAGKAINALIMDQGKAFWVGGGHQIVNAILNAKSQKDFNAAMKMIPGMADRLSAIVADGAKDGVLFKTYIDAFGGAALDSAIAYKAGAKIQESTERDRVRNAQKYIQGNKAYQDSLTAAFDLVNKVAQVGGIELIGAMKPLIGAFTDFTRKYLSDAGIFDKMINFGGVITGWAREMAVVVSQLKDSSLYELAVGDISAWEFLKGTGEADKKGISQQVSDAIAGKTGLGHIYPTRAGAPAGLENLKDTINKEGSEGFDMLMQDGLTAQGRRVLGEPDKHAYKAGFRQLAAFEDPNAERKQRNVNRVYSKEIFKGGDRFKGSTWKGLEGLAEIIGGSTTAGQKVQFGKKGGKGLLRFAEDFDDSVEDLNKLLKRVGYSVERLKKEGWIAHEMKRGTDTDIMFTRKGEAEGRFWERIIDDAVGKITTTLKEQNPPVNGGGSGHTTRVPGAIPVPTG